MNAKRNRETFAFAQNLSTRAIFWKSTSRRKERCGEGTSSSRQVAKRTEKLLSSLVSWSLSLVQLFACFDVFFLLLSSVLSPASPHWVLNSILKLKSTSGGPSQECCSAEKEFSIGNWIRAGMGAWKRKFLVVVTNERAGGKKGLKERRFDGEELSFMDEWDSMRGRRKWNL